jgi:hypothetical protein
VAALDAAQRPPSTPVFAVGGAFLEGVRNADSGVAEPERIRIRSRDRNEDY